MMNLPKLRGAKFLEDQSIPSAKYELTSELKKMPNFSVLLLLTWCQPGAYCQIESKTRYFSFFFSLWWLAFLASVCGSMLSSIIFLLGNEVFSRGTQSSTTQCHSLQERRYQVPAAQRTEMQVSWFVKWFAVFSVFIKITKVSFGKMNHSTFLWGEWEREPFNS